MSEVEFILGAQEGESFHDALARMASLPAWRPFDPRCVSFVARFAQRLLTDARSRRFAELLALGHWFRGARLRELEARAVDGGADCVVLGRGLAFHLAPANVDSVFMYSWLLSALAGNVNIVRLSQKRSEQVDLLADVLGATLADEAGAAMRGRFLLLTYAHDAAATQSLSQAAMLRVVWGGDASVAAIRAIPMRPTATELVFPDRFSAAVFDAGCVNRASATELARLAAAFYNDAFWFSQQACSSPRWLAWIGAESETAAARSLFWNALETELRRREPPDEPARAMARLVATFEYAARGLVVRDAAAQPARFPQRLLLRNAPDPEARALHCGNGLFLEQSLPTLEALAREMTDRDQTLTAYGFSSQALDAFVGCLPARAVDRIVPVGEALTFDTVWDGIELMTAFTRRVTRRTG